MGGANNFSTNAAAAIDWPSATVHQLIDLFRQPDDDDRRELRELALLHLSKCLATHPATKMPFLKGCNLGRVNDTDTRKGLQYCYGNIGRFFAVMHVFSGTVERMGGEPEPRLLKNLIRCYLRLSQVSGRACETLRSCPPSELRSSAFLDALREDLATLLKVQQLFYNVTAGPPVQAELVGEVPWTVLTMP